MTDYTTIISVLTSEHTPCCPSDNPCEQVECISCGGTWPCDPHLAAEALQHLLGVAGRAVDLIARNVIDTTLTQVGEQFAACGFDGATIAEAASWDRLDEPTREILREGVRALLGLDPAPANTIMISGDTAWIWWLTRTVAQHPEELDPERLALVEIPEFPTLDPYVGGNLETVQVLREDEDQPWGVHPRVGWLDGPYTPDEARRIGAEWIAAAQAAEPVVDR